MSLLKVNELQVFNGSTITLTATTVATSSAFNTGGQLNVTGAITVTDASTTRTNLGLGTIATQAADSVNIDGGVIDAVTIGTNSAVTDLRVDNLQLDGNTISSTNTDGNITLDPNGTGNVSIGNFSFDADQTVGVGQDNYVLTYDHSTTSISLEAATGGISDIVSDTTPQLGGNLDVNGNSIVSVSAGNISITPDTTGKIVLDGLSWPTADGSADQVLKTDGAGNLSFVDQSGGGGLSDLEHPNSVSTAETISAGNHRFYVGPVSFSNTLTIAGKMLVFDGLYNQTSGIANITGTLHIRS